MVECLLTSDILLQVHLIEKQEAKRQVLKKRAEQTKVDSDSEINWDEDDEDLENVQDIPGNNQKLHKSEEFEN